MASEEQPAVERERSTSYSSQDGGGHAAATGVGSASSPPVGDGGSAPSRAGVEADSMPTSGASQRLPSDSTPGNVAQWLVRRGYLLTALELHQEMLLEGNGQHGVAVLSSLFTDVEDESGSTHISPDLRAAIAACRGAGMYKPCCVAHASRSMHSGLTRTPRASRRSCE